MMLESDELPTYGKTGDELRALRDLLEQLRRFAKLEPHSQAANLAWSVVWEQIEAIGAPSQHG